MPLTADPKSELPWRARYQELTEGQKQAARLAAEQEANATQDEAARVAAEKRAAEEEAARLAAENQAAEDAVRVAEAAAAAALASGDVQAAAAAEKAKAEAEAKAQETAVAAAAVKAKQDEAARVAAEKRAAEEEAAPLWATVSVVDSVEYEATWGRIGSPGLAVSGSLVAMEPLSGSQLSNSQLLKGAVAVCARGEISFGAKAAAAAQAGARESRLSCCAHLVA